MKKRYNATAADPERFLDICLQEGRSLSTELDLLAARLSREIEKKMMFDEISKENLRLLEDLENVEAEIKFYQKQKENFIEESLYYSKMEEEVNSLKQEIRKIKKQNLDLKSEVTISELYNQLAELRSQEESYKLLLKKDKEKISKYSELNKSTETPETPHHLKSNKSLLTQVQKIRVLKSENFRTKRAWELILSQASTKNHELEQQIFDLESELKQRTRSCRKIKLKVHRRRNSP